MKFDLSPRNPLFLQGFSTNKCAAMKKCPERDRRSGHSNVGCEVLLLHFGSDNDLPDLAGRKLGIGKLDDAGCGSVAITIGWRARHA